MNPAVDLWSITQTDGQMDGRTNRHYQVHYLPRFPVDKDAIFIKLLHVIGFIIWQQFENEICILSHDIPDLIIIL